MKNHSSQLIVSIALFSLLVIGSTRAATPAISDPVLTSIGVITGGDAGEGLDLDGNFVYALSIGADPASFTPLKIRDATFQALTVDEVPGATLQAGNQIPNWYVVTYGDTENDLNLALATSSIRWSAAGDAVNPQVVLTLTNLEVDAEYKVQLMFGEQCCNRGFDVLFDDKLAVKDFNPGNQQGGIANGKQEALITQLYFARTNFMVLRLDGRNASIDYADHNAIFNAITVEKLAGKTDSDNDGLPDAWETLYFGDLSQNASGDADSDSLSNGEEYARGTDPKNADTDSDGLSDGEEKTAGTQPLNPDSDGDGLKDGDEVKNTKTDPLKNDTDGDGLSDGLEVLTLHTNPLKTDTDGDGFTDPLEVFAGSDPTDPQSTPNPQISFGVFTGGDAGEGLDLDGNFVYALAIGADPSLSAKVRDATFLGLVDAEVPGATLEAGNQIMNWYGVNYGDTENDVNLAMATSSIRWSDANNAANPQVVLTLENLEKGGTYKLQLMFGEECCSRGFDVFIDGRRVAHNFAPFRAQGGIANHKQEALITYTYFARDTRVVIRLDGRGVDDPAITDHNAIFNAVTVEKIAGNVDSDNDGLPDEWEKFYLGDLTQNGQGDPDGDGLTNADEYAAGTNPKLADSDGDGLSDSEEKTAATDPVNADTDGDGLKDGDEIKLYKTDPLKADTDADGLWDGPEILTYHTDPIKADTDGDGVNDGNEVAWGTDPLTAEAPTQVTNIVVQAFTGGDTGEGLDLQGNFLYAFNVGTPGAAGKAGDADFTADNAPGIKVTAPNNIPNWGTPELGDTPNDNVLETVLQSIRWSAAPARWKVELADLIPGSTYKVQLLFYEQSSPGRGFNLVVDDNVIVSNFIPANIQGGAGNATAGVVVSAEFTTQRTNVVIVGDGPGADSPDITDHNSILNGVTLEVLNAVPVEVPLKINRLVKDAAGLSLTFGSVSSRRYTIEYRPSLTEGSWTALDTNVVATGSATIYLDNNPARLNAPQGFWRIRGP